MIGYYLCVIILGRYACVNLPQKLFLGHGDGCSASLVLVLTSEHQGGGGLHIVVVSDGAFYFLMEYDKCNIFLQ